MKAYGVDGCRSGWFYFELQGDRYSYGVVSNLAELVKKTSPGDRILVDIPIGLWDRDSAPRVCDQEARRLLGQPRGSSVFPAPIRAVLGATSYQEALAEARRLSGKGLSQQGYAILPKIAQVDELMQSEEARAVVREVHPEICFWSVNSQRPLDSPKKKREGFQERVSLLKRVWGPTENTVGEVLSHYLRKDVARDDIVDALVAAVTAAQSDESLFTVPAEPEIDSKGLPMEIAYARFDLDD